MDKNLAEVNEDIGLLLETILDGINGGLVVCRDDERYSYRYVSEAAAAIWGYEVEEFVEASNGNAVDSIYSEDQAAVLQKMAEDMAGGDRFSLAYRVVCKDKSIRWIRDDGRKVVGKDGQILYYRLLQDVTKQVQTEMMLSSERSRYRDALISNCKYFYSFDLTEGLIRESFASKEGENLLQVMKLRLPVEFDAYIERWMDHYAPQFLSEGMADILNQQALISCFENGNTNPEVEYYSPRWKIYLRKSFLLSRNEQNGHILAFVIVTDTTKTRYDFLSRMSHDIRTPVSAIMGLTTIASRHIDNKERVADCLAKITDSGKQLLNILNEVLDMRKTESDRTEPAEEESDPADHYEDLAGLSVLVVDDEQDTCESICLILEEIGMKGEWVLSGQEALQKVKEASAAGKEYFAVILDWKMPDMNGVQTAGELRKTIGNDIPLVILSAYDWSQIETEARSVGVDGFICKPLFRSRLAYLFRGLKNKEK